MSDTAIEQLQSVDTWNQLVELVSNSDGVACVTMQTLREISGAGRLGSNVRVQILEKINSLGLDVLTNELPRLQTDEVILYDIESDCARMIAAVLEAQQGDNIAENAAILRTLNVSEDPAKVKVEIFDAISHLEEIVEKATHELA